MTSKIILKKVSEEASKFLERLGHCTPFVTPTPTFRGMKKSAFLKRFKQRQKTFECESFSRATLSTDKHGKKEKWQRKI